MSSSATSSRDYIPGIDGLRAIAVLSVVLYHLEDKLIPGGFAGVDIFFVISGYVISKSLATTDTSNLATFVLGFYRRRILRIAPALLVCLVVAGILSSLFIPDAWLSASNKWTAVLAFFGASNFYLVSGADGYFSDRIAFNPFVHTWSLAVEEQFYLFFPFIFFLWLNASRLGFHRRIVALLFLPLIATVSLLIASHETGADQVRAFYLLPSRFWELASGALLFQFQTQRFAKRGPLPRPSVWLVCGAVFVGTGFVYANEKAFPFPWALFPVVGTTLMLAGITSTAGKTRGLLWLLETRVMTYIGRISYSLYLWHWAIFTLFRWTVGMQEPVPAAIALLLTFGLSSASYHLVEEPVRRQPYLKKQPNWKIVVLGLSAVATSSLIIGLVFQYGDSLKLKLSLTDDGYDWSPYHPIDAHAEFDLAQAAYSQVGNGRTIFVVGDSHAGAYTNMVRLSVASLGATARILSRAGCPLATLVSASKDTSACHNSERDFVAQMQAQARPGDIVFLASLRVHRLGNQWQLFDQTTVLARNTSRADREERALALTQAARLIRELQALGLHVLIDAPKPVFRAPPFRCSDWFNRSNPICEPGFTMDRDLLLKLREPTMASLFTLEKLQGIYVWDPFPVLCATPVCSAFDGNKPLFSDADHLSGHGGRKLVPSFTARIEDIWTMNPQKIPTTGR